MSSLRSPGAFVLAVPGCLVTAWWVAGLMLAPLGRHPLWLGPELNLAEAAAARDVGEIVHLIETSADPNDLYEVRPDFIAAAGARLTPLEAAVASQDTEAVRILLVNGAAMDAEIWSRLRCRADHDEMIEFLDARRPDGAVQDCDGRNRPPASR